MLMLHRLAPTRRKASCKAVTCWGCLSHFQTGLLSVQPCAPGLNALGSESLIEMKSNANVEEMATSSIFYARINASGIMHQCRNAIIDVVISHRSHLFPNVLAPCETSFSLQLSSAFTSAPRLPHGIHAFTALFCELKALCST